MRASGPWLAEEDPHFGGSLYEAISQEAGIRSRLEFLGIDLAIDCLTYTAK